MYLQNAIRRSYFQNLNAIGYMPINLNYNTFKEKNKFLFMIILVIALDIQNTFFTGQKIKMYDFRRIIYFGV